MMKNLFFLSPFSYLLQFLSKLLLLSIKLADAVITFLAANPKSPSLSTNVPIYQDFVV